MNKNIDFAGQCLCGAVSIKLKEVKPSVGVCHCGMCRNWVGGPFMSLDAGENIEISGQKNIATYSSSDWAERAFCKQCGSNLFYRLKQNNTHYVMAGLFNIDDAVDLGHQIYIDEKPNYYNFSEDTPKMTRAEFEAMIAVEGEP